MTSERETNLKLDAARRLERVGHAEPGVLRLRPVRAHGAGRREVDAVVQQPGDGIERRLDIGDRVRGRVELQRRVPAGNAGTVEGIEQVGAKLDGPVAGQPDIRWRSTDRSPAKSTRADSQYPTRGRRCRPAARRTPPYRTGGRDRCCSRPGIAEEADSRPVVGSAGEIHRAAAALVVEADGVRIGGRRGPDTGELPVIDQEADRAERRL